MKQFTIIALLLVFTGASYAGEYGRESLEGMDGVRVLIEGIDSKVEEDGLSENQLQIDVEQRLKKADIELLTHGAWLEAPGGQYLYVSVNALPEPRTGGYAYFIRVELRQDVLLARDPALKVIGATTWRQSRVGLVSAAAMPGKIRSSVGGLVDAFSGDYRTANKPSK